MVESTFRLTACREVMGAHPGSLRIERQVIGIEDAVPVDAAMAITLCRVFVETTCKTVCRERGRAIDGKPGMRNLIGTTMQALPLKIQQEQEADPDLVKGVASLANGLDEIIFGISAIRNAHGAGAHGAEAYAPLLDEHYAEIVARATDAAVGLMFRLHITNPPALDRDEANEDDFDSDTPFNLWIDDQYETFTVLDSVLTASEALFRTDRTAYDAHLAEFTPEREFGEGEA